MKEKLSKLIRGQVPIAVIFIALGMCLIGMPASTLNILYKVVFGLALIGSGAYHLFIYIKKKPGNSILDMFSGVTTIILGIFLFSNPQIVIMLLPWMLAGFIVADLAWIVKEILKLRKTDSGFWQIMIMVCLIMVILAVVLAVDPFRTVRGMLTYAGWVLLLKGISDLLIILFTSNNKIAKAAASKAESFAVIPTQKPKRAPRRLGILRPKEDKEKKEEEAVAKAQAEAAKTDVVDDTPIVDVYDSDLVHTPDASEAAADDEDYEEVVVTDIPAGHGASDEDVPADADTGDDDYLDDPGDADVVEDGYDEPYEDSYDESYEDSFDGEDDAYADSYGEDAYDGDDSSEGYRK